MSPIDFTGDDLVIDGVSGKQFVSSLKAAGLSDPAVTELVARALAQARDPLVPVRPAVTTQPFRFQTAIGATAPECVADYARLFVHPDFFDGLTVVQAGETPEELGFNVRFHAIEAEFDAVAINLHRQSNCLAELRAELAAMVHELEDKLTEIDAKLDTKGKEKDGKDTKEIKEKESKEGKDKEKEGKETKEKDSKEGKEGKEKDRKEAVDKLRPVENLAPGAPFPALHPVPLVAAADEPDAEVAVFIRPDERPAVGEQAFGGTERRAAEG